MRIKDFQSSYSQDDDYVFASETMKGEQPYWPDNLMKRHIRPVAKANGIHKRIGWHTFRHTFGTLLKANGEDVKTVQALLRPRKQQNHPGRVHASCHLEQASRAEQGCQNDGSKSG
jgi:site-specific recombinase XerD